jgi:hypothetical protein
MKEAKNPSPESENAPKPASLSPGMATLLQGGNGAEAKAEPKLETPPVPSPEMRQRPLLIRGSLLIADGLLVGLAVRLVTRNGGHLGFAGIALCILAFLVGAWLTCLAIWWPESKP